MPLMIVLVLILIWSLWKLIKWFRLNKKVAAVGYLIVFLSFATILVSVFYPGGFEGMGIAAVGLFVGLLGLLWVLIYSIILKKRRNGSDVS